MTMDMFIKSSNSYTDMKQDEAIGNGQEVPSNFVKINLQSFIVFIICCNIIVCPGSVELH